ncbi:MAG: Fic family protein [Clostridia bacterium]
MSYFFVFYFFPKLFYTNLLSLEEKGANFLYLIVKNHVFTDGNKRIAATLFIYFLNFYTILYKDGKQTIDNNTLAALTLLIAESNPKKRSYYRFNNELFE